MSPVPEPSNLNENIAASLAQLLAGQVGHDELNTATRLLAKWRATLMLNTIVKLDGTTVQSGPFAGMDYPNASSEGSGAARLLGVYEASLAPIIEQIIATDYAQVIDVGCAEGYYAVGLARRMPNARIIARDANPNALVLCQKLATDNGVLPQIHFGGNMVPADFDICLSAKTVVICDIEGGEETLLDPTQGRGLLAADILVETHDCITSGLSQLITKRFAATHNITLIDRAISSTPLPAWMNRLSDFDRLMAIWEWRSGPTPWLWMTKKDRL